MQTRITFQTGYVWANGGSSYFGVCYPIDNRDLLFETLFSSNGNIAYDKYSSTIASKELEKILYNQISKLFQEYYISGYNFGVPDDPDIVQKIKDDVFSLEDFLTCMNVQSDSALPISFRICINTDEDIQTTYEEEYEVLNLAAKDIKQLGEPYGITFNLTYWLYFLPSDIYTEGVAYFNDHARANSTFDKITLGKYETINRCIRMDYDENANPFSRQEYEPTPITQEDYIEMRKSLD